MDGLHNEGPRRVDERVVGRRRIERARRWLTDVDPENLAEQQIDVLRVIGSSLPQPPSPTLPAPVPGGPTTLQQIANELSETWCAARGDITGPRS